MCLRLELSPRTYACPHQMPRLRGLLPNSIVEDRVPPSGASRGAVRDALGSRRA